jgi:hypothetical protein
VEPNRPRIQKLLRIPASLLGTQLGPVLAVIGLILVASPSHALIISMIETNLDGDAPAIISPNFGEDALAFSDRTHQHNGAAFDATGTLSTTGSNIVGLPAYLKGGDYVRFANNARENIDYTATVFAAGQVNWFLLVDNRLNGPATNTSSSNTTDPVLGGSLQWVIDGNWQRVNTGKSPNGQADYTGVDEGGNGIGAGMGLNQFYSVYQFPLAIDVVTVRNNGISGSNMISLIAVPEPSSALLVALGLAGILLAERGGRKKSSRLH